MAALVVVERARHCAASHSRCVQHALMARCAARALDNTDVPAGRRCRTAPVPRPNEPHGRSAQWPPGTERVNAKGCYGRPGWPAAAAAAAGAAAGAAVMVAAPAAPACTAPGSAEAQPRRATLARSTRAQPGCRRRRHQAAASRSVRELRVRCAGPPPAPQAPGASRCAGCGAPCAAADAAPRSAVGARRVMEARAALLTGGRTGSC
jgi:hypothetical protein